MKHPRSIRKEIKKLLVDKKLYDFDICSVQERTQKIGTAERTVIEYWLPHRLRVRVGKRRFYDYTDQSGLFGIAFACAWGSGDAADSGRSTFGSIAFASSVLGDNLFEVLIEGRGATAECRSSFSIHFVR